LANFNTHFVAGAGVSTIFSGTLLAMGSIDSMEALMAFAFGTLGGLLPDIDSNHSKAIDLGFTLFSMLITILVVFVQINRYSLIEMFILGGLLFAFLRYGVIDIFRKISKHRGMFHSVPASLIWGLIVAILVKYIFDIDDFISWIYGIMVTIGYLTHLILDEIYSVDLKNRRIKRSFGTALKFYKIDTNFEAIQTGFLYLTIFYLFSIAPDTSDLHNILFNAEAWDRFSAILLPSDGRLFLH
jgi:membrane-bound metal-dependent hydrolase YbcI (DUF457 family)